LRRRLLCARAPAAAVCCLRAPVPHVHVRSTLCCKAVRAPLTAPNRLDGQVAMLTTGLVCASCACCLHMSQDGGRVCVKDDNVWVCSPHTPGSRCEQSLHASIAHPWRQPRLLRA
jgi:hypothetical protein